MSFDTAKSQSMRDGGAVLRRVKNELTEYVKPGYTFEQIEGKAVELIVDYGAKPSFSTVKNYHWATCLMLNDALCHGIPVGGVVADGDLLTIDVGLIWQGYHLDTSVSFQVGRKSDSVQSFLEVGRQALKKAIFRVKAGQSVYEISSAMQKVVERAGYEAVTQLTGHGIGKNLHEDPEIPCVAFTQDKSVRLTAHQTIAVEIMYASGSAELVLGKDGWTYSTKDGSLSAMFEETVEVLDGGHLVLT